jgi:hypothetical protein
MARFFNTSGPCEAHKHYMLPAEQRIPDLLPLVEQEQYFVLHAARQTGKTTAMQAFARRLRAQGVVAVWATLETSQRIEDLDIAEPLWIGALEDAALFSLPEDLRPDPAAESRQGRRLQDFLQRWCQKVDERPVVVLLDEADVVTGPALVSLLRQLRGGFMRRGPGRFPVSVALIGMRDLRDYLAHVKDGVPVNPGSPFNIKSASITLRNFTAAEVASLYAQHTEDTGQVFTPEASARAFWWTQGQPFLVNALARICVMELVTDRSISVEAAHIDAAKERLVLARTTHLDSLAERLKEERVARVVQPALLGDTPFSIVYDSDDFEYVVDLGLLRRGPTGAEASNPLYREVLARQLSYNLQMAINQPTWRWQTDEGRLDFPALLEAFFDWWRENEDAIYAHGNKQYPEALPHLAFMAFLQRVVNGGGQVMREFAAGRGAVDIVVTYGPDRFVVEIKRIFKSGKSAQKVRDAGIQQLASYLDALGEQQGWLIIFDQRGEKTWEQRLWKETAEVGGRRLHIRGA